MTLTDLPTEILLHISSFLNAKSLCSLGATCNILHCVLKDDFLWQRLCQRDYQVSHKAGWGLSFKKIYTRILHPYPILGFQKVPLQPSGGLMHITWEVGEIKVNQLFGQAESRDDLVSEPAFFLTWNHKIDALEATCCHTPGTSKPAEISKIRSFIMLRCILKNCYENHRRPDFLLGQCGKEFPKGYADPVGIFERKKFKKGYNCPLLPLEFLPVPSHFPVTPGIYKGKYGSHGVEMLHVRISKDNPYIMECMKITGDPNVPAGKISLSVYLDKPVIVAEEDQAIDQLISADARRHPEAFVELLKRRDQGMDWVQPFIISDDCHEEPRKLPEKCKARYLAQGQIAHNNFKRESFSPVHTVIFDEDTFGFLWLELQYFTLLHRMTETFGSQ